MCGERARTDTQSESGDSPREGWGMGQTSTFALQCVYFYIAENVYHKNVLTYCMCN